MEKSIAVTISVKAPVDPNRRKKKMDSQLQRGRNLKFRRRLSVLRLLGATASTGKRSTNAGENLPDGGLLLSKLKTWTLSLQEHRHSCRKTLELHI
ncbi:hypothetical protein Bca4012_057511 [Brassica carinata]